MNDIISIVDLATIPGITATDDDLNYAARRASAAVASSWCNPIDPAPQWVKDISIDVAVRFLANPLALSSVTRSVDDASRTEQFIRTSSTPGGFFSLTDDEIDRLCPKVRNRVGSIRLRVC